MGSVQEALEQRKKRKEQEAAKEAEAVKNKRSVADALKERSRRISANVTRDDISKYLSDSKTFAETSQNPTKDTFALAKDLDSKYSEIFHWLSYNKDNFDEETYENMRSYLNGIKEVTKQYSKFDSEHDYALAVGGDYAKNLYDNRLNYYAENDIDWEKQLDISRDLKNRIAYDYTTYDAWQDLNKAKTAYKEAIEDKSFNLWEKQEKIQKARKDITEVEEKIKRSVTMQFDTISSKNILDTMEALGVDPEDEFAEGVTWQKLYDKKVIEEKRNADDYAILSAKRDFKNPTSEDFRYYDAMMNTDAWYTDANGVRYDALGNKIPNKTDENGNLVHPMQNDERFAVNDPLGLFLSMSEDERETIVYSANNNGLLYENLQEGVVNHWEMLNDQEISDYYYLLNTEGKEAALQHLRNTAELLNSRWGQERVKSIQSIDNGFMKTLATGFLGFEAGLDQWSTGVAQAIGGKDIPISGTQFASAEMANSLDGLGKYAYNATVTVGNMLPSILISKSLGGAGLSGKLAQGIGSTSLGLSAGGNAYGQALKEGYSDSQAKTYGVLVGASEAALQNLIGGIGSLGGISDDLLLAKTKMIDSSLLRISAKYGIKIGSEIAEEELQNYLEPAFRSIIFGEDYDAPTIEELLETAIVTAMSTGALEGGSVIATDIGENRQLIDKGKTIMAADGVSDLVGLSNDLSGMSAPNIKSNLENLSGKVSSRVEKGSTSNNTARKVGRLYYAVSDATSALNQGDIVKSLTRQGFSEKEATTLAEAMIAREKGAEYLSPKQNRTLDSYKEDARVQNAESRIVENEQSTMAQRKQKLNAFDENVAIGMVKKALTDAGKTVETNTASTEETAVKSEFEVSAEGKTINTKTGAVVNIQKIDSISEGGEANLTLDDGMVVKASDLAYGNDAEALLVENIGKMKLGNKSISTASANALYQIAKTSITPDMKPFEVASLIKGLEESYVHGVYNFGSDKLTDSNAVAFANELTEEQRKFAYELGAQDRASETESAQKFINDLKVKGKHSKSTTKKGNVRFAEGVAPKGKLQKRSVSLAKHLAKAIGIDIVFYDARTTTNEDGKGANGYFDEATDTIYLDLQNSHDDAKTIVFTLSHEIVHFIKKWSPAKFDTFAKFLVEQYTDHGVDISQLVANKMAALNTNDRDLAYEEVICDACETMLLDSNAVYKLMELRKSDLELFDKIKLHIHDLLNAIRDMYKSLGLSPTSDEAKAVLKMKDSLEQIYSLFEDAAVDAVQSYQAVQNANETIFGEESVNVGKTESGIKNQLKNHKKIGEDAITYNGRHKNVQEAILKVGVESMYEMAETMLPYLEEEGILPPDIPGKTIFKNGSYGRTGENTTLCVRTLTYEDFKDRVAEELGRPLTVSESLLVSQKIYDIATEPQCIYCYVAADRKAYDGYLGEYWKAMDKYIKALRKGGDSKALYTEYLAGRKDTAQQQKRWSQWEAIAKSGKEYISAKDLTTKRKRDALIAKKNAFSEQIKDAQRYAQSASWAKTVFDYRAYKGDILKMTSKFVDMLNSEYGLRMYSFSDYTPAFIVENMQMIIDASVKGLKSLAYTKDTDYAEIFASTGQAINVSCFAKWDAESGTYVEDNRQGANWEKTKSLRKQYRNVGAVMVATNDAMVEWALKQDWVDVVIPYHIVKTGTTIANEYQWNNYTSESADRVGNKTANIYPTEHNNDFATYSNLLNERGITPRFSRWYDKVASGELTEAQYMKLVNEVRLPASELSAVVPSFNLDAAKKSFGVDNEGNVIKGGFVDKGGYMGGWYRQGVDVNQEVMAVSEDIKAGKSSLDVDYGMSKAAKEKAEEKYKPSIKKQAKKIRAGMSENERYSVLKDAKIVAINDSKSEAQPLYNEIEKVPEKAKGQVEALIKDLADDLEILNVPLSTTALDIEFQLSKNNGLRESLSQQLKYGGNFHDFSKALINLRDILNRAILVEVHTEDRYKGTVREDVNFEAGYVLFSAFKSQEYVIPVKLEIKQKKDVHNILYVVVSMTKIKRISVMESALDDTEVPTIPLSDTDSVYSLPHLVSKINSKDRNFLKYLPDQMLSAEQSEAKRLALKEDKEKLNAIPKKPSSVKKQLKKDSEGNALSKEQQEYFKDSQVRWGENLMPVYHGTRRKFTVFDATEGYDENRVGGLMWAAKDYEYAKDYSYSDEPIVMKGYLNITNMLDVGDIDSYANYENRLQELADLVKLTPRELESMVDYERILIYDITSSKPFRDRIVELGYDGVVAYESGLQTFGFVDSNQFKDTTNKTPTADPDIRYQKKRNIVPIESEDLTKLENHFGTTGNFKVAGYLLTNGKLLYFSGKHWGDTTSRTRQVDHRDAQEVLDDRGDNGFNAMIDMIGNGNIRLMPETGGINLAVYPNEKQRRVLSLYIRQMLATEGQVIIDYDDVGGDTVYSRVYEKHASPSQILADIRNYFQGGRQSELMQFHTMHQKKKDSNRSILANALEGAAQNDIEKNKLAQYKEKISLIESEEQRLSEIQQQLFTKGGVEPEKRKDLQFEAKQIANRINTYDRQLLNLEATTALKNVLSREKALAMKRQKQKDAEAMRQYKEKVAKTTMRHTIKNVVSELNQLLLRGTKDKHVMIGLQKAVAEALDAVNMDTVGAEERVAHYNDLIAKAKDPDIIASLTATRDRIQAQGDKMSDKLTKLKNAYNDIKNSDDPLIANSYDEVISSRLEYIAEKVGDTPLRDMTLEQLEDVYDMYKMVLTTIRNSNKSFKNAKNESIATLGNRVMMEVEKVGGKKKLRRKGTEGIEKFAWNNLKPIYAFNRIGSDTLTEVFNNVRAGEDTWAVDVTEAREYYLEQSKKHNYDSWDFKKRYKFTSTSGMDFELSLEQIMSLYAYSKREQAAEHLRKGGIVFDETTEVTIKNKLGIPMKFNPTEATAYNLSVETLADIVGKLTNEQRAFVDEMQAYLSDVMGEKGNEVSLVMYGVKLFKEKFYFPLKSATQFMAKAKEQQQGEVKIKNSGFSKETVQKASNPIVLTPFMDVWANHVNEMSMYHAFVLPMEDFYKVFNYKTPTSDTMATESVEMFIQNAYGKGATQYIEQLLKDLNGGAISDPRETFSKALMSKFKKAAVMASLSVVVQQPTAMIRAMALVDMRHFGIAPISRGIVRTVIPKKHKALWAEVKKYAPIAIIKEMGRFDTHMGQSVQDYIKSEEYKGLKKIKGFFTDSNYRDDVFSKLPALADEMAWVSIWNAVKRETVAKRKDLRPNSEEFLKVVGERFTEVITKTQVYDSVLSRSANMRAKSALWTSFMAEPTTSINMLEDALRQGKRGNKKYAAKAIGAVYGSIVLNAALVSLVYAMRDDDEDETFLEKYASRLTTELLDGINPITYIPFLKDAWSIAQGFDIERADMSLVADLTDTLQQAVKVISKDTSDMDEDELAEHQKEVSDALWGIADNISSLVGLPTKNVRRDINGVFNLFETLTKDGEGRETTAGSLLDEIWEDVKSSIPVVGWLPNESKQDKLYDAIVSGDTAYEDRLKSGYEDDKAYESAVRKALRENDTRIREAAEARMDGDIAEYTRIVKEIKGEGNFSQDTIVAAVNAEINALSKGEDSSSSSDKAKSMYKIDDYFMALDGGDEATAYVVKEDLIETDVANGKDREEAEESFNGKFTSYIREKYEEGELSEQEAERMLVNYGDKSEDEAASKVQYWEFKQEYPDYDDLSEEAVAKYYNEVEPHGIDVDVYYDYSKQRSKCKGVDANGDGKTDSGSVKAEVLEVIDSLPITRRQKDALYYLNGWSAKTIYEAPWH